MVFFPVPGANFDLASFSFQVPICGLAKQSVPAAKHSARVSSDVFVFMSLFQTGIGRAVNIFSNRRNFSSRIRLRRGYGATGYTDLTDGRKPSTQSGPGRSLDFLAVATGVGDGRKSETMIERKIRMIESN